MKTKFKSSYKKITEILNILMMIEYWKCKKFKNGIFIYLANLLKLINIFYQYLNLTQIVIMYVQ